MDMTSLTCQKIVLVFIEYMFYCPINKIKAENYKNKNENYASEHKRQFKEMHGCEIVKGESWGNWEKLIFNTEEDATMFLLKWS